MPVKTISSRGSLAILLSLTWVMSGACQLYAGTDSELLLGIERPHPNGNESIETRP